MKWLLVLLISSAAHGYELSPSERMSSVLQENGIPSWGKRNTRQAGIVCKVPRRTQALVCNITAIKNVDESIFVQLKEGEARDLSRLLLDFGIKPYGRRSKQDLEIVCRDHRKGQGTHCEVVEYIFIP
jgi:hypothetical protein